MAKVILLLTFFAFICLKGWSASYSEEDIVGKKVELQRGLRVYLEPKKGGKKAKLTQTTRYKILEKITSSGSSPKDFFRIRVSSKDYYIFEDDLTEAGVLSCTECTSGGQTGSNTGDLFAVTKNAKASNSGARLQTISSLKSPNPGGWDRRCAGFIQSDGSIGVWGQNFLEATDQVDIGKYKARDYIFSTHLWKNICPKFKSLSDHQKEHFVVTFVAAKAMDEANCNSGSIAWNTPNPPGVGFFMLEGQSRLRNGRSPTYCGGGLKGTRESLPVELQFSCAAYQMVVSQYQGVGPFCSGGSGYWQEANRTSGDICETMRGYKACFE